MKFKNDVYRSRNREAQLLARELRASVDHYHTALAKSLAQVSRGLEEGPDALTKLVTMLDARLMKTQAR